MRRGTTARPEGSGAVTIEQLNQLINVLASITLFEMMIAIGLGVALSDVWQVATDWRLIARAMLASYVVVPAAAVGLLVLFQATPFVAAGLLICAVCPGAPYGPPFTSVARGNVSVSVGLMVMLAGSSALMAPLLLQELLPFTLGLLPAETGDSGPFTIDGGKIVATLLITQLLPICIGLGLRHWSPTLSDRIKVPANRLGMVLNLMTLGLILYTQFDMLLAVPLRGYLGMSLLVFVSVAAGWLLGGGANRSAMVMATSVRNVGVALVIVTAAFGGTRAVAAATAFALFQTLAMALVALAWGRFSSPGLQVPNAKASAA